ncbi:MAG: YbaB/EbfC family nucleoid-associated protein [Elusimicrobiales bacterium]|nr:YbaB/EbfC family nucleoid-associated protein [Elusimicrobiales bacterium]NLH38733.1 YbaB/EbfC family nucleoid-associated protein [Elusimicrobiota bacterium]
MFDKMKDIWELKKKADEIKKELEKINFTSEDNYTSVTVKGTLEIENITIKIEPSSVKKEKLEDSIKDNINKAMRNAQMESAKKTFGQMM